MRKKGVLRSPAVELWNKFNSRKGENRNAMANVNIGLSPCESGDDAKHSCIFPGYTPPRTSSSALRKKNDWP